MPPRIRPRCFSTEVDMFFKNRLRRLEHSMRGRSCAACGLPPDGPGYIVFADDKPAEELAECCGRCGRRLYFVIEVAGAGVGT